MLQWTPKAETHITSLQEAERILIYTSAELCKLNDLD